MSDYDLEWYNSFFGPDYLKIYSHVFDFDQSNEQAKFVQDVLQLQAGDHALDLCCGQGRISIPLAKQGINMTGLDFSKEILNMARLEASNAGVEFTAIEADMREIPYVSEFDAVINVFTAFGYFYGDAENQKVLNGVAKSLKKNGLALFDLLNRDWVVSNHIEREWRVAGDGTKFLEERNWDAFHGISHIKFTIMAPDGTTTETGHHIRLYVATEFTRMLEEAGLSVQQCFGGYDKSPFDISGKRMIVIAQKD